MHWQRGECSRKGEMGRGKRRKRVSEGEETVSVKGQQPTLRLHLASRSACVCFSQWKSARATNDPIFVFVYLSAWLRLCIFVRIHSYLSVLGYKVLCACSLCVSVCVLCEDGGGHSPDAVYTGTELRRLGHIWDTSRVIQPEYLSCCLLYCTFFPTIKLFCCLIVGGNY